MQKWGFSKERGNYNSSLLILNLFRHCSYTSVIYLSIFIYPNCT